MTVISNNPYLTPLGQYGLNRFIIVGKWERPANLDIIGSTNVYDYFWPNIWCSNSRIKCQPLLYLPAPWSIIFVSLKPAFKDYSPMGTVGSDLGPIDSLPFENLHGIMDQKAFDLFSSIGEPRKSLCMQRKTKFLSKDPAKAILKHSISHSVAVAYVNHRKIQAIDKSHYPARMFT